MKPNTKTPAQLINPAMLKQAAHALFSCPPEEPALPPEIKQPCADAWERKWLALDCWHPDVQRMAAEVRRFCARWFKNDADSRLLILSGHTGCGKTHCLMAVGRVATALSVEAWTQHHWHSPPSLAVIRWPEVAAALAESGTRAADILRDGMEADLLLLDDVGAETDRYKTGLPVDALCQLLSRRQGKWTLVTTNIAEVEWHTRFDVRVADRLHRNAVIVDLTKTGSFAIDRDET